MEINIEIWGNRYNNKQEQNKSYGNSRRSTGLKQPNNWKSKQGLLCCEDYKHKGRFKENNWMFTEQDIDWNLQTRDMDNRKVNFKQHNEMSEKWKEKDLEQTSKNWHRGATNYGIHQR